MESATSKPANIIPPAPLADRCRAAPLSHTPNTPIVTGPSPQPTPPYTSDAPEQGRHRSASPLLERYRAEFARLCERLTPAEHHLYAILLYNHVGLRRAIPGRLLVVEFNDSRWPSLDKASLRWIQEAVYAIRDAGLLVGSSTKAGVGYYIPATREEADASNAALHHRARSQWRIASKQKRAADRCFPQLVLFDPAA